MIRTADQIIEDCEAILSAERLCSCGDCSYCWREDAVREEACADLAEAQNAVEQESYSW